MKLLAVETATMMGGAAIMEDDRLVAETRLNIKTTHSERLLREIDSALSGASMKIDDIDVFGISIGPGSFTGLRVGLSAVKGLVYATGKRLVTASTLEALAWNMAFSGCDVCPMLDARRKEVYAALFRWNGSGFDRVAPEGAYSAGRLLEKIEGKTVFIGEGALLYRDFISEAMGGAALFGPPQHMIPSPACVAYLCMNKARAGLFTDPVAAAPAYHRRSEAEIKFV
jgi:tRNA threonylcarbamoyladenosine biosynthesis protein TsaB